MWKIGNFRFGFDKIFGNDFSESLSIMFFSAISRGMPKLTA